MPDIVMRQIQANANARYANRVKAQERAELLGRKRRAAAYADEQKAVRAVQWRTRFSAVERKLMQVKTYLRYNPQSESLRREAEELEAMYRSLLAEAG